MPLFDPEDVRLFQENFTLVLNHHYKAVEGMLTNLKVVLEVKKFIDEGQKFDEACESAHKSLLLKKINLSPDAIRVRYYRLQKRNSQ